VGVVLRRKQILQRVAGPHLLGLQPDSSWGGFLVGGFKTMNRMYTYDYHTVAQFIFIPGEKPTHTGSFI